MGKVKQGTAKIPPAAGEVLTLAEAATFLRVDEASLEADANADRVPGRRVGGEWRFHRAGLTHWLATGRTARGDTPLEAAHRRHEAALASGDAVAVCETFLEVLRELREELDRYHERGEASAG